jgi:hypothetical protein
MSRRNHDLPAWGWCELNSGEVVIDRPYQSAEEEGEERPWEQPGCFRLDCEPHRGHLLKVGGAVAIWCGLYAVIFLLPALVGLPLGVVTAVLAARDLEMMRAGRMDPAGWSPTRLALYDGAGGAALSLLGAALWGLGILWVRLS